MESFDYKKYTWIAGMLALVGIFFASLALGASEWKSAKYPNGQTGSITVSGEGEVTTLPDVATVTITIRESAKTVPEAQKLAEAKVKAAVAALSKLGVRDLDQKTLSYNVSPKYENVPVSPNSPVSSGMMYPTYNQKVVGYEVTQSVEIKVRDIEAAGEIIGALGAVNITEIYGPSFAVDNTDEAQAEAKAKAIAQAREKAKATAKALGADLGEVIQFSEDNGGNYPMYAKTMSADGRGGAATPEVTLPQGENVIKSRVTITYSLD